MKIAHDQKVPVLHQLKVKESISIHVTKSLSYLLDLWVHILGRLNNPKCLNMFLGSCLHGLESEAY